MSRKFARVGVGFIVRAADDLPGSLDADDVREEVRRFIEAGLGEWFEVRGKELLSRKPEVL